MTLTAAIEAESGSHAEVLAAVKARTITSLGSLQAGFAQTLLVSGLILPVISKTANLADHANPLFHGACQALMARINGSQSIDLAMPGVETMFDLILINTEVQEKLAASNFVNGSTFKAAVLQAATVINPEFPGVTLHDVIAVKEPALAVQQESNTVNIKGISTKFKLTTATAMPETVRLTAEVSHDGIVWQPVQTAMLESVSGAGLYVFRVLPGPVFLDENGVVSQIRVVSPYSVGLTLV